MQADDASGIGTELRAAAAAFAFLTRVPIGRLIVVDSADIARAGAFFPLAGAAVGAAVGGVALGLGGLASGFLTAAVAVGVGTVVTGALHLDALADTADALGARAREEALAIMREHTIGAYGAVALVLGLLLEVSALADLTATGNVVAIALTAGALSRAAPVVLAATLPYARPVRGLGLPLTDTDRWRAAIASALAVSIAVVATGGLGLLLMGVTAVLLVGSYATCRTWLGGVTGDTLGATVQLIEIAVLCIAAIVSH